MGDECSWNDGSVLGALYDALDMNLKTELAQPAGKRVIRR